MRAISINEFSLLSFNANQGIDNSDYMITKVYFQSTCLGYITHKNLDTSSQYNYVIDFERSGFKSRYESVTTYFNCGGKKTYYSYDDLFHAKLNKIVVDRMVNRVVKTKVEVLDLLDCNCIWDNLAFIQLKLDPDKVSRLNKFCLDKVYDIYLQRIAIATNQRTRKDKIKLKSQSFTPSNDFTVINDHLKYLLGDHCYASLNSLQLEISRNLFIIYCPKLGQQWLFNANREKSIFKSGVKTKIEPYLKGKKELGDRILNEALLSSPSIAVAREKKAIRLAKIGKK